MPVDSTGGELPSYQCTVSSAVCLCRRMRLNWQCGLGRRVGVSGSRVSSRGSWVVTGGETPGACRM